VKIAAPVALLSLALSGCGTNFDPPSLVESVRLLAIAADEPYAAPGDTVNMTALAFDGRADKPLRLTAAAGQPSPMQVYWVPVVCPDPPGDAYFACYPAFGALLSPGVDLTSLLTAGPRFSFRMPEDIVTKHPRPRSGSAYGVVVVFAMACAGHVQLVDPSTGTLPPAPPLGCFDDTGKELGPNDSVFAYAQVFSFADGRTNANPVITGLTFGDNPVDPVQGITVTHCPPTGKCASTALDTTVPSSSWELDPADPSASGTALHEEIWVNYFVTAGGVANSALLYEAMAGKLANPVQLTPPTTAGEQVLWAVLRDNRGGVSWLQVPLHVE
jgi:hypothetical protein